MDSKVCTGCNEWKTLDCYGSNGKGRLDGRCKRCRCDAQKARYRANPDKYKQKTKDYYAKHSEERKQYRRDWSAKNYDKVLQYRERTVSHRMAWQRGYRHLHKHDAIGQRVRMWSNIGRERWAAKYPERVRASRRKWRDTHKEMVDAHREKRRARQLNAEGSYTASEWKNLCAKYHHQCLACSATGPLQADHIVPLTKGGTNYISNIQPLCGRCNKRKGTKVIDYRQGWQARSGQ